MICIGFSRKAMIYGPLFVIGAIALLVWNEGNAVTAHRSLDEGAKATISVENIDTVDPANEGKLVHMIGQAETLVNLVDNTFGVAPSNKVLKLKRNAEMYQWVETETSSSATSTDTTTTYKYTKGWKSLIVDSSFFHEQGGHQNPGYFPYQAAIFSAVPITFGAFTLSSDVVKNMDWFTSYSETLSVENIPDETLRGEAHLLDGGFYVGSNATYPSVGDTIITYEVLTPQKVSIVAQQIGNSFEPYATKVGKSVLFIEQGPHAAVEMYQHAQAQASAQAWMLRIFGFFLLYIGIFFLFAVPFLGNLVGGVTSCIMFPIALVISLTIIAFSWLAYRPLLAIPFLALVGLSICYFFSQRINSASREIPIAYQVSTNEEDDLELQKTCK
jgi:hypothetical protein